MDLTASALRQNSKLQGSHTALEEDGYYPKGEEACTDTPVFKAAAKLMADYAFRLVEAEGLKPTMEVEGRV